VQELKRVGRSKAVTVEVVFETVVRVECDQFGVAHGADAARGFLQLRNGGAFGKVQELPHVVVVGKGDKFHVRRQLGLVNTSQRAVSVRKVAPVVLKKEKVIEKRVSDLLHIYVLLNHFITHTAARTFSKCNKLLTKSMHRSTSFALSSLTNVA